MKKSMNKKIISMVLSVNMMMALASTVTANSGNISISDELLSMDSVLTVLSELPEVVARLSPEVVAELPPESAARLARFFEVAAGLPAEVIDAPAVYVSELTSMDFGTMHRLPEDEVITYVYRTFGVDVDVFNVDDLRFALVTVASAQRYMENQFAMHSMGDGYVFTNGIHFGGVGWLAPGLTFWEAFAGTWLVGVDFLALSSVAALRARTLSSDVRDGFASILSSATLTAFVVEALRSESFVIARDSAAIVVGNGVLALVTDLPAAVAHNIFNSQADAALIAMIDNPRLLARVEYRMVVSPTGFPVLQRSVSAFTPSEITYGVFKIPCPNVNGGIGNWRLNNSVAQ